MKILNIYSPNAITEATELLGSGHVIIYPTDTLYGLGADACNDIAVASIFSTKKRPRFNPLIVHVHNKQLAEQYAKFSDIAAKIAHIKNCCSILPFP